jgi:hypothetical protein
MNVFYSISIAWIARDNHGWVEDPVPEELSFFLVSGPKPEFKVACNKPMPRIPPYVHPNGYIKRERARHPWPYCMT